MWNQLNPGQKWAAIIGLPFCMAMMKGFFVLSAFVPWEYIRMIINILAWFAMMWIYVNSFGIWIAAIIQILFYRKN